MKKIVIAMIALGFSSGASAQSTGYPACDEYIRMVSECIRTKMPESERAEAGQQLDYFRHMLTNSIAAPALAGACEENIRIQIQRDRYGCYAHRAASTGVKTACSLVSPSDLNEIFGSPFAPGDPGSSKCRFTSPAVAGRVVTLEVAWTKGRDDVAAWRAGSATARREMQKTTAQPPIAVETFTDLGDEAFVIAAGFMPMLVVRKGDVALSVQAPATREQLVAIARKALAALSR